MLPPQFAGSEVVPIAILGALGSVKVTNATCPDSQFPIATEIAE